jgi:hypothetical protein
MCMYLWHICTGRITDEGTGRAVGSALVGGYVCETLKKRQAKKCTLETATTRSLVILNMDAPRYTTA